MNLRNINHLVDIELNDKLKDITESLHYFCISCIVYLWCPWKHIFQVCCWTAYCHSLLLHCTATIFSSGVSSQRLSMVGILIEALPMKGEVSQGSIFPGPLINSQKLRSIPQFEILSTEFFFDFTNVRPICVLNVPNIYFCFTPFFRL